MRATTTTRISEWLRNNVLGLVAIFIALSGTAYATHPGGANTISSGDIINGEVKSGDIGDFEVKAADVAPDSLGGAKIANGSVKNADLSIGASSSNTITDGGIQGVDVKNNTLTGTQIDESTLFNDDSLTDEDLATSAQFNGTAIRGGDLAGTYPHPTIADGAISGGPGGEIIDNTLADDDLAAGAVTPDKLGGPYPAARVEGPQDVPSGCPFDGQSIPNNVETALTFQNVGGLSTAFDPLGMHTAACTADSSKLTAPRAGLYQVSATVSWLANTAGIRELGLKVNGSTPVAREKNDATGTEGNFQNVSTLVKLSQSDFVQAVVRQTSGTGSHVFADSDLAMAWVGPG